MEKSKLADAPNLADLGRLAELIRQRNENEKLITAITNRPAQIGHIGEYIASRIFAITLAKSATEPGMDGRFDSGPLAGQSVNVKMYAKRTGILDINSDPNKRPDYYLVLAGPKSAAASSKGQPHPWVIEEVFLFEAKLLIEQIENRGVEIGIPTSVISKEWEEARIYPVDSESYPLSEKQKQALCLFGSRPESDLPVLPPVK